MSFSRRVTLLSFVLMVLVVWVHAVDGDLAAVNDLSVPGGAERAYIYIQEFLGESLGQIAVPGFFCISGYLFFRNMGGGARDLPDCREYGADPGHVPVVSGKRIYGIKHCLLHMSNAYESYVSFGRWIYRLKYRAGLLAGFFIRKWQRRVWTLLVPYLLWNTGYMMIYMMLGKAGTDPGSLVDGILFHSCNPVFWYMEELIKLTVLAPVIFLLICRRIPGAAALTALLLAAACYAEIPLHIVNEDALFYYALGAYAALHAGGFVEGTENARDSAAAGGCAAAGSNTGTGRHAAAGSNAVAGRSTAAGSSGFSHTTLPSAGYSSGRCACTGDGSRIHAAVPGSCRSAGTTAGWLRAAAGAVVTLILSVYLIDNGESAGVITGGTVMLRTSGVVLLYMLISLICAAGGSVYNNLPGFAGIRLRGKGRVIDSACEKAVALSAAAPAGATYVGKEVENNCVEDKEPGAAAAAAHNGKKNDNTCVEAAGKGRIFMDYNFLTYATHYLVLRFYRAGAGLVLGIAAGIMYGFAGSGYAVGPMAGRITGVTDIIGMTDGFAGSGAPVTFVLYVLYILLYILMPALCIMTAAACGCAFKRLAPRLYRLLTGGRG